MAKPHLITRTIFVTAFAFSILLAFIAPTITPANAGATQLLASISSATTGQVSEASRPSSALFTAFNLFPSKSSVEAPMAACQPSSGCIPRESGDNARWWATSWTPARCMNQTDTDWRVFYSTDNSTWRNANINSIRFSAAWWSTLSWWPRASQVQAEDPSPPGVTLCLSRAGGLITGLDVSGTWVWLRR